MCVSAKHPGDLVSRGPHSDSGCVCADGKCEKPLYPNWTQVPKRQNGVLEASESTFHRDFVIHG